MVDFHVEHLSDLESFAFQYFDLVNEYSGEGLGRIEDACHRLAVHGQGSPVAHLSTGFRVQARRVEQHVPFSLENVHETLF
jgi:hypothetical protein